MNLIIVFCTIIVKKSMNKIDIQSLDSKYQEIKGYLEYYDIYGQPLVDEYAEDLDEKVDKVSMYLASVREGDGSFDVPSLQKICMDLSISLYYTQDKLDKLNLLADMSKIKYKDSYNESYMSRQSAAKQEDRKYTVEQLKAIAEQEAIEENLINFIYTRASSILKGKIDAAYELLKSCSKSLSAEIQSMQTYQVSNKYNI